jgi:hypothetical protein
MCACVVAAGVGTREMGMRGTLEDRCVVTPGKFLQLNHLLNHLLKMFSKSFSAFELNSFLFIIPPKA